MKLVQGRRPDGVVIAGALDGDRVTQLNADATDPILPLLTVAESDRAELAKKVASTSDSYSLDEIRLLPPVRAPGKVLAVARGYQRETEPEVPSEAAPYLFLKRADDVLGPADEITIGPPATSVVAEIEIALVIGRTARNLSVDEAVGCIAGYTIANDVSARSLDLPAPGRRDRTMDGFID